MTKLGLDLILAVFPSESCLTLPCMLKWLEIVTCLVYMSVFSRFTSQIAYWFTSNCNSF